MTTLMSINQDTLCVNKQLGGLNHTTLDVREVGNIYGASGSPDCRKHKLNSYLQKNLACPTPEAKDCHDLNTKNTDFCNKLIHWGCTWTDVLNACK
jgi:hypothetical protein